jgi:hypothetical protein
MGAKIKTCSFDSSVLWPYNLVEDWELDEEPAFSHLDTKRPENRTF